MKATNKDLAVLHAAVARALTEAVAGGEDKDGNPVPPSAATLAVAIQFLKANSITADAETDEGLLALKNSLRERRAKSGSRMTLADADALLDGAGIGGLQ